MSSRRKFVNKVVDMFTDWMRKDKEAQAEAVKRLGLPENNTAADRAKAMGFGDDVYHGTDTDFTAFKDQNTFVSPDPNVANRFAGGMVDDATIATDGHKVSFLNPKFYPPDYNPQIMPLKIRGNVFDYENPNHIKQLLNTKPILKTPLQSGINLIDDVKQGEFKALESTPTQKGIKKSGFDGFNVEEFGAKNTGVFNPANIRSKFAHFNPKYLGVGAGSILSADLMADELDLEYKGLLNDK